MYTMPQSKEMSSKVVSSRTSRTAASMGDSPGSTKPFGKSQLRYARSSKNFNFLSSTLTTTTPADIRVGGAADGMARLVGITFAILYRRRSEVTRADFAEEPQGDATVTRPRAAASVSDDR